MPYRGGSLSNDVVRMLGQGKVCSQHAGPQWRLNGLAQARSFSRVLTPLSSKKTSTMSKSREKDRKMDTCGDDNSRTEHDATGRGAIALIREMTVVVRGVTAASPKARL